jgi:hypothetical protein
VEAIVNLRGGSIVLPATVAPDDPLEIPSFNVTKSRASKGRRAADPDDRLQLK